MKKVFGLIMTIIGGLGTVFGGWNWYSVAAGIWESLNKDGNPTGPIVYIIVTLVGVALAAAGVYLLTRKKD